MAASSRFSSIGYILNSIRIKSKAYMSRLSSGGRPYDHISKLEPVTLPTMALTYKEHYQSFEYFTYETAVRYYSKSDHLISRVIEVLCYHNTHGGDEKYLSLVEKIDSQLTKDNDLVYHRHTEGYERFEMKAGAISGILQAKLASMYIRAHRENGEQNHLDKAKGCLTACLLEEQENGPYRILKTGTSWIEEYPSTRPTMVLNGHLFLLIALVEYKAVSLQNDFDDLLDSCMQSTLTYLPHYWSGKDILYSLHGWDLCNVHYLGIQTYLFRHLYSITGVTGFKDSAERLTDICPWDIFNKMMDI